MFRELSFRAREMGKQVCVSGILSRLGENEKWWLRALNVNERIKVLCQSMNCSYLDVWEDLVDSFKLYKIGEVHLYDKSVEVSAKTR